MSKGICKAEIFETFHIVPMAVKRILKKFKHSGTHFHKKNEPSLQYIRDGSFLWGLSPRC